MPEMLFQIMISQNIHLDQIAFDMDVHVFEYLHINFRYKQRYQ